MRISDWSSDVCSSDLWYNNQASLNNAQWRVDGDGILRVVVSAKDPGVPNWLDTSGYPSGAIQGRWTDCNAQPVPSVRKVAVAEVRASLPAETHSISPEERSEEHTSELQSIMRITYAVFCLKKK